MPDIVPFLEWLEGSWAGVAVRESDWMFPSIETFHLFGIIIVVASTMALDLRLLNWWLRPWRASVVARGLLPWTWAGFALMVVTGAGLFVSDPIRYFYNDSFRLKMILLVLAGVNAFIFTITVFRSVDQWDLDAATPTAAKIAGICSMLLWFAIVAAGRWIAFV
jgi:hypothetical protein